MIGALTKHEIYIIIGSRHELIGGVIGHGGVAVIFNFNNAHTPLLGTHSDTASIDVHPLTVTYKIYNILNISDVRKHFITSDHCN